MNNKHVSPVGVACGATIACSVMALRPISRPTPRLLSFALCLEWINVIYNTPDTGCLECYRPHASVDTTTSGIDRKHIHCTMWVKKSPPTVFWIFSKRLGIFNQFFTHLLHDHFYTRLQIFIQISPTLTKLCRTKRDHLANFYTSLYL